MTNRTPKLPKPRKRRTQTLADKGTATGLLYCWKKIVGSYVFNPSEECSIFLTEQNGQWNMKATLFGKRYAGTRPTLEDAFKSTAHLMFKHAKDYWLRMDARVVTEPWSHSLPEVL